MKLGFITSILQDYDFEQTIDFASKAGFRCMEVACWPRGKAERRYAGVSHLDVANMDEAEAERIRSVCREKAWRSPLLPTIPTPWIRIRRSVPQPLPIWKR